MRFIYNREQICKIADDVRQKYCGSNEAPVDVELLWEDLGGEIRPVKGLGASGTEAVLYGDFKVIAVDYDKFLNDSYHYRMRFSIAHEMGHYFLHCDESTRKRFSNPEEFYEYYNNLDVQEYKWGEWHANEFAGRLLVPLQSLHNACQKGWDELLHNLTAGVDINTLRSDSAVDYFAKNINAPFQVSADCIAHRLRGEDLWPPDKFGR